jgi:hypothetical protein
MLLFRYFGSHALETLRASLFKTATVSSLNDPFELLYRLKGTMTTAKAKRHLKQRLKTQDFFAAAQAQNAAIKTKRDLKKFMANNRGKIVNNLVSNYPKLKAETLLEGEMFADRTLRVVCFSESNVDRLDEILIWSHYANKHSGMRIGFEFPDGLKFPFKIIPVEYRQERVGLDLTDGLEIDHVKTALMETIKVKSLAWKYEREYRMVTSPQLCVKRPVQNGADADFIGFKKEWVKYVDVGLRASQQEIQTMKQLLGKEYPEVQLRRAVLHATDYALDYESI